MTAVIVQVGRGKSRIGRADQARRQPPTPPRPYQLTTKREYQTVEEWLAAWAKLVRGCKAAKALDKLQTARETNRAHIDAEAASDPEVAATLIAQLDRALSVARQDA